MDALGLGACGRDDGCRFRYHDGDNAGSLTMLAETAYEDLTRPDVVVVLGGPGTVEALGDADNLDDGAAPWAP